MEPDFYDRKLQGLLRKIVDDYMAKYPNLQAQMEFFGWLDASLAYAERIDLEAYFEVCRHIQEKAEKKRKKEA